MSRILIIDDDVDTCMLLSAYLVKKGYETESAFCGNKGLQKFKEENFDLIICDYRLGDKEGGDILKEVKEINPAVKVIIITGYSDIKTAVRVIKQGAFDYIAKPLIPDEVLNVIRNAEKQPANSPEMPKAASGSNPNVPGEDRRQQEQSDGFLTGNDPIIRDVYRQVDLVAPTNYSVILYGESGTGKEVIAKTIHQRSPRMDKPFVALDCGTLSRELAGSELFGHVKGAFTGALTDKTGHFELANGGTLFLDEVANLSYDVQASLLRVIQERKFKRIGGLKEMNIDIRIIVASNENLEEAHRRGRFREDLFHRLNEFSIVLPPLRHRKEDIPLFAHYFLKKVNEELDKNILEFGDGVMEAFINYAWPGNIRELKNVLRRAALLANNKKIIKKNLPWYSDALWPADKGSFAPVSRDDTKVFDPAGNKMPQGEDERKMDLKDAAYQAEYEAIMNVLKQVNYNKSQAATILKIDRKTLYNKLKNFKE